MAKSLIVAIIASGVLLGQTAATPLRVKSTKHQKWHTFAKRVDHSAKIAGECVLVGVGLAAVAMASNGTPIQVR
jgi:hypothetical protein